MDLISLGEGRFECQQSGHCCSDPNIIVTLTYRDLFRLFTKLNKDFRILLQKISFYKLNESDQFLQKQMVLESIQTSDGNVIPGLRKLNDEICTFYAHPNCLIYPDRPMSCRSYPLAYIKQKGQITCTWVRNSPKTCPGIGKGTVLSQRFITNLGNEYFQEIETHNQVVRELNKEALNGRPLTAREALWILITYGEKDC